MKLSDLIPHTSEKLDFPMATVRTTARALQPLGFITCGGRGPGGSQMTPRDCVALLIGLCGTNAAMRSPMEVGIWKERVPNLIEYLERRVESGPTGEAVSLEFDVDKYCARKIGGSRTQTFGKRPESASYLTRTVTAEAFRNWLDGLQT